MPCTNEDVLIRQPLQPHIHSLARSHAHTHTLSCSIQYSTIQTVGAHTHSVRPKQNCKHTHTHTHNHTHSRSLTRTHARTHTHTHTQPHTRAHTHTHTQTYTHIHTRAHTRTHTTFDQNRSAKENYSHSRIDVQSTEYARAHAHRERGGRGILQSIPVSHPMRRHGDSLA